MSQRALILREKLQAVIKTRVAPHVQTNTFRIILIDILNNGGLDIEELIKIFFEMLIRQDVDLTVSRKLLSIVIYKVLPELCDLKCKVVGKAALAQIQFRLDDFVHQAADICQYLARIYEKEKKWKEAAVLLMSIDVKKYPDNYKFENYINIARLYIEDGQLLKAETNIQNASKYLIVINNALLKIRYKKILTRLFEHQKKFGEAAFQYYELSIMVCLPEEVCMSFFKNSFECALLSSIGPHRIRMLALLHKDSRSKNLAKFSLLTKLCSNQIINQKEISELYETLQPHNQKAKTTDGVSVLHQAILEHNILGISKIYKNVFIDCLGFMLDVDAKTAEKAVAKMISENCIQGSIDQIENIVSFKTATENILSKWSNGIKLLCTQINCLIDVIKENPL